MKIYRETFLASLLLTLLCSTCFGLQSGSRSSAPSGNLSAPSVGPSFSTPTAPSQSFSSPPLSTPIADFNPSPAQFQSQPFQSQPFQSQPFQSQPFPGQSISQFQYGTQMPSAPQTLNGQRGDSVNGPPTDQGSSSLGIPAASLVDPIFEINDPNSFHSIDHSAWNCFLSRYVTSDQAGVNRVSYGQVSQCDRQVLLNYLQQLQATDVRTLNRNEQLAYWINLYNVKTVSIVLANYPIFSIRQVKEKLTDFVGPFDDEGAVQVLGKPLSLNDIESGIVRPVWKDPRIHYALNCASFGCPNLSPMAWTANDLEGRLDSAAYNFINSGRAVKSTLFGIRVSKIYKWYEGDFGGSDQAVLAHIRQYASGQTANTIANCSSISGHFYNWSLNDGSIRRRRIFQR